jgi:hypothetical protein
MDDSQPVTLDEILDAREYLRRLYSPGWEQDINDKTGAYLHKPIRTPSAVTVTVNGVSTSDQFGRYDHTERDAGTGPGIDAVRAQLRYVAQHREPYTLRAWSRMAEPLQPMAAGARPSADTLFYEHIEDERMQLFSFIGVPDPRKISDGDWVRLATIDDSGASALYPYSPDFLAGDGFRQFAYDRFWHPTGIAPAAVWHTTRWLNCGYGFTAVGASSGFFADDRSGARFHFRSHYWMMGLIAHFHRASLLGFKARIAKAAEHLRGDGTLQERDANFRNAIQSIERDFLVFRSVYWFSEVSNQIQGRELFDLFVKHLRTQELFTQLRDEIGEATATLSAWATEKQSEQLGENMREMVSLQENLHVVEMFIVIVYAIELAYAAGHVFHFEGVGYRTASFLMVVVIPIAMYFLTKSKPKEVPHERKNGRDSESLSRQGPVSIWGAVKNYLSRRKVAVLFVVSIIYIVIGWQWWQDPNHGKSTMRLNGELKFNVEELPKAEKH